MRTSRLIIINLHYPPDVAATGQYVSDLAEFLVGKNWEVHVWAGQAWYRKTDAAPAFEIRNGVSVRRLGGTSFGRKSVLGRLSDYGSFLIRLVFHLLTKVRRGDTVISLTTPPLLGVLISFFNWRGFRQIHWVMDLHPEAEAAVGMISSDGLVFRVLKKSMAWSYRTAHSVVSLGPAMRDRLIRDYQLEPESVIEIPIWSDYPKRDTAWKKMARTFHWPQLPKDAFVVNYSGNLGLVHDTTTLLDVIRQLQHQQVYFTFSGDGPKRLPFEKACAENGFDHVYFKGYVDRSDVEMLNAHADVNWFSLEPSCGGIAVPSKAVSYLAAGIPVLYIGPDNADPYIWLNSSGAGETVRNGESEKSVAFLLRLKNDPEFAADRGTRARMFFESHFQGTRNLNHWYDQLR